MLYLFGLLGSALSGFLVGALYQSVKQDREIRLLRDSLSYWRNHLGLSYKTFDPDLYDE